jgi:uncharacterized protein (TIGR02145 family)
MSTSRQNINWQSLYQRLVCVYANIKTDRFLLAVGVTFAMAFMFSCSSENNDGTGGNSGGTAECSGVIYNTANKFCYNGEVYDKCSGIEYNPTTYYCQGGAAYPATCNGSSYNPLVQNCCASTAIFNLANQRCSNGIIETKCGIGSSYHNPATQFCNENEVVNKCEGMEYNLANQRCNNNVIEIKCGTESSYHNPATQFCNGNEVVNKCGGKEYNPLMQNCCASINIFSLESQRCNNGIVETKCENDWYNEATQSCVHGFSGSLTDNRDGQTYKTVGIGTQIWMAKNLNYNANESVCYDNQNSYCVTYGRLYNWATAKVACPTGWHLPTQAEWNILSNFVGGSSTAAKHLKARSGWNNSGNGEDTYGFTALPGGYRFSAGGLINSNDFQGVGDVGSWWSASEKDNNNAYDLEMHYLASNIGGSSDSFKRYLLSVRCVKD